MAVSGGNQKIKGIYENILHTATFNIDSNYK